MTRLGDGWGIALPGRPVDKAKGRRLLVAAHLDALRLDPAEYLKATAWRVRGFRLRSRNRFAALLGRSHHAYPLWMACEEPRILEELAGTTGAELPLLLFVVDATAGEVGIERTLASLSGLPRSQVVCLGRPERWQGASIDRPSELVGCAHDDVWVCAIRAGDRLAPAAHRIYAHRAKTAGSARLIYADDDLIDAGGCRHNPHLKPDWNPDLFGHHDFLSGACIVRTDLRQLASLPEKGWERTLILDAIAAAEPVHCHAILHHRQQRPEAVVPAKPVDHSAWPKPSVTVVVPTRNQAGLLRTCMEGLARTAYPDLRITVIDNGSDDPDALAYLAELRSRKIEVLALPGPFNYSALNNVAVGLCSTELLCFLNNDIEVLEDDWLALLVRQAIRPEVGAVGAQLLYPDHTIQHAGVCTGIGGGAAHAHRYQSPRESGYFERARLPQFVSAVTGACLVVSRAKFLAAGGFEEVEFPVAFNDVDLCLKLTAAGWRSYYEPNAVLIHHESKSRGLDRSRDKRRRFAGELAALKRKWGTDHLVDPYHHPFLSPFCEEFLIRLP